MRRKRTRSKKTTPQLVHWIEIDMPQNIDISSWLNPDGSLNVEKMQEEIKKELIEAHQKTMEWQRTAILFSVPTD